MLLLTYKALTGLAPDYIKDLLRYNDSRRTLRSSNNNLLMSLEQILKRMVKEFSPWRHQGSGIKYHSGSGFHHQRQFLRLILRLNFLSVHLINFVVFTCSSFFYSFFETLSYYIAHLILRILIFRVLKRHGQLMENGAILID